MYDRQTISLHEVKPALNTRELQEKQGNLDNKADERLIVKGKYDKKIKEKRKQKKKISRAKTRLSNAFNVIKKGILKRIVQKESTNKRNKRVRIMI